MIFAVPSDHGEQMSQHLAEHACVATNVKPFDSEMA